MIVAAIERELAALPGTEGVAARHLGRGEEIRVNADEVTATASTIKVPILIDLFRQVEAGEAGLETKLLVSAGARTVGPGILRELSPGIELTVRDHATLMTVVRDNISTNVLIALLGIVRINATMAESGFSRTRLVNRLDFPVIGSGANYPRRAPHLVNIPGLAIFVTVLG